MTKKEMIAFLEPFTEDVQMKVWDGYSGSWVPVIAKVDYTSEKHDPTYHVTTIHLFKSKATS